MSMLNGPGYDYLYLKDNISIPLSLALAEVSSEQPDDPVEYIGKYLLHFVQNENRKLEQKIMTEKRKKILELNHINELNRIEKIKNDKDEREKQKQMDENAKDILLHIDNLNDLYNLLLRKLVISTSGSGAYIGRKVITLDNQICIQWEKATEGSEMVLEKSVTQDKGVTFDVFKEIEVEVEVEDNEGKKEMTTMNKIIDYIYIDNVLRDKRVLFYGIPKLGSYLACSINYKTYLYDEILDNIQDGPLLKDTSMVLAVDTLGQGGKKINKEEINNFIMWSKIYKEAIEACEKKIYLKEIQEKKKQDEELNLIKDTFVTKIEKMNTDIITELEKFDPMNHEKIDGQMVTKEIFETRIRVHKLNELFISSFDIMENLSLRMIPYKIPVLRIFASVFTILGITYNKLFNIVTKYPCWNKIKLLLKKDIVLPLIQSFVLEKDMSDAKHLLENSTIEEMDKVHPFIGFLFRWSQASIVMSETWIKRSVNNSNTNDESIKD